MTMKRIFQFLLLGSALLAPSAGWADDKGRYRERYDRMERRDCDRRDNDRGAIGGDRRVGVWNDRRNYPGGYQSEKEWRKQQKALEKERRQDRRAYQKDRREMEREWEKDRRDTAREYRRGW